MKGDLGTRLDKTQLEFIYIQNLKTIIYLTIHFYKTLQNCGKFIFELIFDFGFLEGFKLYKTRILKLISGTQMGYSF